MKEINCSRCKVKVGELSKAKVKKDIVYLCGACNYRLLMLENKLKETDSELPEFLKMFGVTK